MRFAEGRAAILEVPDHWLPDILELDAALEELMPGYEVLQVKVKFGGLRYYWQAPEGTPEDIWRRALELTDSFEGRLHV